ncbi:integral membrane protein [Metarhizium brunneum]
MELRGAASSKGSPDTRSILTSTMAKISTGTSSPRKSSFLQLQSIPPPLRPLVRAYLLGYASAVLPRLLTLVLQHLSNRKRKTPNYALPERDENTFLESAKHVLKTGLDPCRFPTFCAALVGGATLLQAPLNEIITRAATNLGSVAKLRLSRFLATFVSAWFSLKLLQSKKPTLRRRAGSSTTRYIDPATGKKLAGRTVDLTLFAATQAIDVIVGELWARHKSRRLAAQKWTKVEAFISQMTDPVSFVASCALIMWAWFYAPDNLPRAYNKWITSAAHVDIRLIEALRRCRTRELSYEKETGQAHLLGTMCTDHSLPYEWGDPCKTIPFPCDIVHMGRGPSCEYHAWRRFWLSWKWSMYTYLPLALALQLRKPNRDSLRTALLSAARSSAFLGTYITLFYYGVCLGRTRIGPHLLGKDVACRQKIDGGYCVGVGCFLCGWSVLIETANRRKDMALFVAPRAMATLLPRQYKMEVQWRETLAFALSTAVVFTCARENPRRVRGMLGGILGLAMKE